MRCWGRSSSAWPVHATFQLSAATHGLNPLRYDLRKLKGRGLLERDGTRYAYDYGSG